MKSRKPRVLFLFLDGVGIGGKKNNPFFVAQLPTLRKLLGGTMPYHRDSRRISNIASLVPLNATLGVPGLPQSGTGQATLLTGINAARIVGRHFGPHPYSTLKPLIRERNIFTQLRHKGKKVFFANAFPQRYFDYFKSHESRIPVIALSWLSAGMQLNTHESLASGKACSADITNEGWPRLGYPHMKTVTPQEAGRRLISMLSDYDFILYEYYFTDDAGHRQSMQDAVGCLEKIDGMLEGIVDGFDREHMLCIVTSDHGNVEDLSVKTHTRNPVPLLAFGKGHREFTESVKSLTDITPALLKFIS